MFGLSLDRDLVVEGAARVDEVLRVEDSATIVALIAAGIEVVTVRTFTFDETVRKKSFILETVELRYLLAVNVAILFHFKVEVADELFVDRAFSSCIVVKLYLESLEEVDDELVILVGQLAGRNA